MGLRHESRGPRRAAMGLAAFRIAYAAALTAAPQRFGRRWLGAVPANTEPVQVALRGLGVRDGAINVGVLVAAARGGSVRPWLAAAIAGDSADLVSTIAGRRGLPPGAPPLAGAVIAASIAAAAAVYVGQER